MSGAKMVCVNNRPMKRGGERIYETASAVIAGRIVDKLAKRGVVANTYGWSNELVVVHSRKDQAAHRARLEQED